MSNRITTNVSASVHQRLLNMARASDRPFNELLVYYGIERFLYRLSNSRYAERFILKGCANAVGMASTRDTSYT